LALDPPISLLILILILHIINILLFPHESDAVYE